MTITLVAEGRGGWMGWGGGSQDGMGRWESGRDAQVMAAVPSSCRLTLQKTRLLTRAAKSFMSKSPGRASDASSESDSESTHYLPLVSSSALGREPLGLPALCREVH